MNTTPSSTPHPTSTTALVLGGGGSTGNAWLIGVLAGLVEAGLDVTTADVIVGTSAGSTVAVQIAGATPAELLAANLAAAPQQQTGPVGSDRGRVPSRPVADHMEQWFDAEACDGFSLAIDVYQDGIDAFVDGVVPILQQRGIYHEDYAGTTLRDHLDAPPQYGTDPRLATTAAAAR